MTFVRIVSLVATLSPIVPTYAAKKLDLAPRPKPAPAATTTATGSVAGTWMGYYVQPVHISEDGKAKIEARKISFTMYVRETEKGIEGEISETNQYGNDREKSPTKRATFIGKVGGNHFTFTKLYEASEGGIVEYVGELDPTRRHLSGTWKRDAESAGFEADLKQAQAVR